MHVVLLGPVGLYLDDRPVPMVRPQQAIVLAALAVDAGRAVPVDTLVDRVWGLSPPPTARRSLQAHIARIKQVLHPCGTGAVVRRDSGYLLDVDPSTVDLHRFTGLIREAQAGTGDDPRRADLLDGALRLWQGVPLAGMPGMWAMRMREAWTQQYLDAVTGWARAEQEQGRAHVVTDRLAEVVGAHPAAESVVGELMRALHATGQTAGALTRFAALRKHLADNLGVEPGEPLRRIHLSLLRENVPAPAPDGRIRRAPTPSGQPVPSGMQAAVPGFVGRSREMRLLDDLLPADPGDPTPVVVVSGMAGVGKTTLAVQWARQIAQRFPDGQIYLNLRGFDPRGAAMTPSEALFAVLEALGVDARQIPFSLDGQISLYRSTIASRRMLLLLDNVGDPDHVRPLLPGSPGGLVIITSRSRLVSLVAIDGASSLTVDPFTDEEARALLMRRLGPARLAAEPAAVDRLVASCAGLPLAMAIIAARAATCPELGLANLAGHLPGSESPLDAFDSGDPVIDMRSVFSWSFAALNPPAARLFRLLALHPGHTVTTGAAASVTGVPTAVVRSALAELTQACMLSEPISGRYTVHDLLRAYAVELVATGEPEETRAAATKRLLDHYLHTAHLADRLMRPDRSTLAEMPCTPAADVTVEPLTDERGALQWCSMEYHAVLATAERAAAGGWDRHAWQLVWCMEDYVEFTGRWWDFEPALRFALEAAKRHGDLVGMAQIHRGIARICLRTDRSIEAVHHLRQALAIFTRSDATVGLAATHRSFAVALASIGQHQEAFEHEHVSLRLAEASGDLAAQALTLNNLGFHSALVGLADQAIHYGEQALALQRRLGCRNGEARALSTVASAYSALGRHEEALGYYEQAIEMFGELGDRTSQAETLPRYGDAYEAAGDLKRARDIWKQALHMFESIGNFDVLGSYDRSIRVRERLAAVRVPAGSGR